MMRVLPSDDSHNWGSLLLHLYPPEMYTKRGLHMSVLRALAHNPAACMEAPVLELEEKKGLQKLFSVDGNLAALPRRAASFLQTRHMLAWPPSFASRFVPPRAVLLRTGAAWLAPAGRNVNTSCGRQTIRLPQGGDGAHPQGWRPALPASEVRVCATAPLQNLSHLVETERLSPSQAGAGAGEGLPFDLGHHAVATSVNAVAVLSRMEEDYRMELRAARDKQVGRCALCRIQR
eukprot:185531-Prorocentrum_minimum.AAC.4